MFIKIGIVQNLSPIVIVLSLNIPAKYPLSDHLGWKGAEI